MNIAERLRKIRTTIYSLDLTIFYSLSSFYSDYGWSGIGAFWRAKEFCFQNKVD